jgi:hypothetical protein
MEESKNKVPYTRLNTAEILGQIHTSSYLEIEVFKNSRLKAVV